MPKYNFNDDKYLSNSFMCYRWMNVLCKEFGVSEGAKNLYALVFAFTKDGTHEFIATQQYVADMIYCSVSSVKRYTKELIDANLIDKSYSKLYDEFRVKLRLNNDVLNEFFGCDICELYTIIRDSCGAPISNITELEKTETNICASTPLIMDINISKNNGLLSSKPKKQSKPKKSKENKYTQFVNCLYASHYPNTVIEVGERYIKWLLSNRKVDITQWEVTIKNLNNDLNKLNSVQIREEAAIDAFNNAFSGGYQKVFVDRYKYGKYMYEQQHMQYDTQKCDSKVEEVANGVYQIVKNSSIDFVKDESGNVLTF